MDRFVTYVATKRGMGEALQSVVASNSELYAHSRAEMLQAITSLLEAAAAASTVRSDFDPEDVLRAMGGIWLFSDEQGWHERAHRLLRLLMDGLRYGAESR